MQRRTFLFGSLATVAAGGAVVGGAYLTADGTPKSGSARPAPPSIRQSGDVRTFGSTQVRRKAAASDAPNVVFIALDDCNDWLGFLNNHPGTSTPNLDALAKRSLSFTAAYTAAPMCNPARTAVMFGQQPFTANVYDHSEKSFTNYNLMSLQTASLVDDMWGAGYDAVGAGKLFNDAQKDRWSNYRPTPYFIDLQQRNDPTIPAGRFDPDWISPYDGKPWGKGERSTVAQIDFGPSGGTAPDDPEGKASRWVADRLKDKRSEPLFLAYGAICTHLPWRIPQQFFDLHPLDGVVVPDYRPDDLDDLGTYAKTKIIDTFHVFDTLKKSGNWQRAVQAYQAAISYADDCVGRVLNQLADSRYADNTIVVVWADHGWHLGEKLHMEKFTLWERATHIPFLVHAPGRFTSSQIFDRPVSAIDIGPTVVDLCGVKVNQPNHQGQSLLPVVADPVKADARPPISTWRAGNNAVRRGQWRYIRYLTNETELYDHSNDPDEYTNLSGRPGHAAVEKELAAFLPPIPTTFDTSKGSGNESGR